MPTSSPVADQLEAARADLAKATTAAKLATAKRARLAAEVRALELEAEIEAMRIQLLKDQLAQKRPAARKGTSAANGREAPEPDRGAAALTVAAAAHPIGDQPGAPDVPRL